MAANGYVVYVVRAARPNTPRALRKLNSVGVRRDKDLLDAIREELLSHFEKYVSVPEQSEGFRVREMESYGRSLRIKINKGPEGAPGETFDTKTSEQRDTTHTTAMLSELRAAVFIPNDSYYGLLFVERHGVRNLKELIRTHVMLPLSSKLGTAIRLEHFAELDDWKRELSGKKALRVSESLVASDSANDASTPDDTVVKISVEGVILARATETVKRHIFEVVDKRTKRFAAQDRLAELEERRFIEKEFLDEDGNLKTRRRKKSVNGFTIQDENDYKEAIAVAESQKFDEVSKDLDQLLKSSIPIKRSSLTRRRVDVSFGEDRPTRTFVVDSDQVPQFVYETNGRLLDPLLYRAWEGHAAKLFEAFGVTLSSGWLNRVVDES